MTKVSIPSEFQRRPALQLPFLKNPHLNPNAFLRRMQRVNAGRANVWAGAAKPAAIFSDARLLMDNEALETAWRYEVAALMVMKELNTPEAAAIANQARAATAAVVRRIETARATTPAGRQVKARAILWRRDGEPLEPDFQRDAARDDEQAGFAAS
jgi:hypothetical protein